MAPRPRGFRVIAYLDAENAYAKVRLKPMKPLLDEIATELQARATPEDKSVPTAYNGYFYQRRFMRGSQYPLIVRWDDPVGTSKEEIVLDVAALAAGQAANVSLGHGPSVRTTSASPSLLIFTGTANFAFLFARFRPARWSTKASKMLPLILYSPGTVRPSSTSARNPERSARISFGATGLAATRQATCLSMRRKTQLLAFRSISLSRGNSCF